MTQRERWILYPIVFLALGTALRDKMIPPAKLQAREILCERIECRQLVAAETTAIQSTSGTIVSGRIEVVDDSQVPRIVLELVTRTSDQADAQPLGRLVIEGEADIPTVITGGQLKCDVIVEGLAAEPAHAADHEAGTPRGEHNDERGANGD